MKKFIYSNQDVTEEDILKEILDYATKYPQMCSKELESIKTEL